MGQPCLGDVIAHVECSFRFFTHEHLGFFPKCVVDVRLGTYMNLLSPVQI